MYIHTQRFEPHRYHKGIQLIVLEVYYYYYIYVLDKTFHSFQQMEKRPVVND